MYIAQNKITKQNKIHNACKTINIYVATRVSPKSKNIEDFIPKLGLHVDIHSYFFL